MSVPLVRARPCAQGGRVTKHGKRGEALRIVNGQSRGLRPGAAGSMSDGRVGAQGAVLEVACSQCGRKYEKGPGLERRGRKCFVCHVLLFPELEER